MALPDVLALEVVFTEMRTEGFGSVVNTNSGGAFTIVDLDCIGPRDEVLYSLKGAPFVGDGTVRLSISLTVLHGSVATGFAVGRSLRASQAEGQEKGREECESPPHTRR